MNLKKNVAAILTGITLASMPAMAVSANGMPKNSSNYWNKPRYIRVTKNTPFVQRTIKNHSIQPKINRKKTVKKGTILVIYRIPNDYNGWRVVQGIKSSKNDAWTTEQKHTNWMRMYIPKKVNNTKTVTLTKNITITEKAIKNHKIQNKELKTFKLKKGENVHIQKINGKEWLIWGNNLPKISKNSNWFTNNKGTKWMKDYKIDMNPKDVIITKDIDTTQKQVKNRFIQNKTMSKATLKAGSAATVQQIDLGEWVISSNNLNRDKNSTWIIINNNNNWMKENAPLKSQYSTTPTSDIGSDYTDAYFLNDVGTQNKTIAKGGQKIEAKKIDANNALIRVDGNEYPMPIDQNTALPTRNNVYNFKNSNSVFSLYAPNNPNAVALSSYSPKNNYLWQQNIGNNKSKIFTYSEQKNGWIYEGIFNNDK